MGAAAQAAISAVSGAASESTDVASLRMALAANSPVCADSGIYVLGSDGLTVPAGKQLTVGVGSRLQLAGSLATDSAIRTVVLNDGSSFSGELDCNRRSQDKTAFNAAGGSAGVSIVGILASGTFELPLTNLNVDARIVGCADLPAYFHYVNDSHVRIRASDCGGQVLFSQCDNLRVDIEVDDADNDGWKVFPHAVDFLNCTRIHARIVIRGQKGTGTVAAGTALSNWFSGLTVVGCSDMYFYEIDVEAADLGGQSKGLGVSILGTSTVHCSQVRIVGYSDALLELGGVVDSTFVGLNLDGRYSRSVESNPSAGLGITLVNVAFDDTLTARTLEYARNVKFLGGTITRCMDNAINLAAAIDTVWIGVSAGASLNGLYMKLANPAIGEGPAPSDGTLSRHRFIACDFSFNERNGVRIYDGVGVIFQACIANNNSQSISYGVTRRGLEGGSSDSAGFGTVKSTPKTGVLFDSCQADDLQDFDSFGFPDPNRAAVIAVQQAERYGVGQTITVAGAGTAGGDLRTRVNGISRDELALEDALATFPVVTVTGTIAVSGTAVMGSGTFFNSDLVGRAYIKAGANYRRIAKVSSDTAAVIESPFPSDLREGTELTILRTTITVEHSQLYGYLLTEDTTSPLIANSKPPAGNVASQVANLTAAATALRYTTFTPVVPAASTAAGFPGEWAVDATHFYVCVASDTWLRVDLASW